jgi:hypothetical protein
MTDIKMAILKSLEEERQSRLPLVARSVIFGFALGLFLSWMCGELSSVVMVLSLSLPLSISFALFLWPQPRLAPRGYATWASLGKLGLATTLVSGLQILLCPEMTSGGLRHGPLPGVLHFTHILHSWAGMNVCMFMCGFIFSGIAASVGLSVFSRALSQSPLRILALALLFTSIAQTPAIAFQLASGVELSAQLFWIFGTLAGFGLSYFAFWRLSLMRAA